MSTDDKLKPEIKVNQEYTSLVPQLSAEEYESLKQSIKENGLYVPIIVNQDGVILDGHHRYKICQELGIKEPKTIVQEFKEKLDEQLFVIDCNLKRRQLNNFQRTELALKSKSILTEIAKKNMSLGGKSKGEGKGSKCLEPLDEKGVAEEIGKIAGVSHETVRKADKLLDKAPEDVIEKLRTGEMSISQAFTEYGRGNKRFADCIHNQRDTMRLWISGLAEMFVCGRNEKHSDDEIKDRIRGFEIDATINAKGEWYDDIAKDVIKSMLDTAIEEAKKLADRIADVDCWIERFAKMEKEGKNLTEDKGTAQGIGFRHDWQMLVIESEDKIQDSKEEGLVHTFKEKKAIWCDIYVTTDDRAYLKLYDTNADLKEEVPKLPSTDDYVRGNLYRFVHVTDDKKEHDDLIIEALSGYDVDYYRNTGMYITEADSHDPEKYYIIGISDKPTHPEIVDFKNLYESPLCIKNKEKYSTGNYTVI